jgi:L-alanine-DL-glutamate epimerase-like enolase superfamily enzyme
MSQSVACWGAAADRLRAYAGMLGFSTEPERAGRASAAVVGQGFTALKWYLPHNATAGAEGLERNVALVRAVRQAIGDEVELMLDCILSGSGANSLLYATELARRMEEYHPTWLEEPLAPDDLDGHAALARATRIPVALGERLTPVGRWAALAARPASTTDPNALVVSPSCARSQSGGDHGVPVVPHASSPAATRSTCSSPVRA